MSRESLLLLLLLSSLEYINIYISYSFILVGEKLINRVPPMLTIIFFQNFPCIRKIVIKHMMTSTLLPQISNWNLSDVFLNTIDHYPHYISIYIYMLI